MSLPKDDREAKRAWLASQPSIDRPLGSRDPGLIQVDGAQDVRAILQREEAGEQVPVYRARTAPGLDDPLARARDLIRSRNRGSADAQALLSQCSTPSEMAVWTLLHGSMDDDARAALWIKVAGQLAKEQAEQERLNIARQNLEEKRVRNALELDGKLRKLKAKGLMGGEPEGDLR